MEGLVGIIYFSTHSLFRDLNWSSFLKIFASFNFYAFDCEINGLFLIMIALRDETSLASLPLPSID
jgi:hypothetical protein